MYIDITYIVLVIPAVIFSLVASARVSSTFKKYSKIASKRNLTGYDAARYVLDYNGLSNIPIERISGNLTDHYDPAANVIRLSSSVYGSNSTAAIGVAAHEAGHAIQHANGYLPIKVRSAIIPVTNFASRLSVPLIIIGFLISGTIGTHLVNIGIIGFALCAFFQLVTLPTEFNASSRALKSLESFNILDTDELKGAKKVLSAAAMTYVAALAVSLTQLLRFIILANGRRSD
ncbi:MAG: zinc metallopeptidase [Lachnospiraceae bacterium]|nr:zinc metallopeptidase [Lachnospiraceae bacterium]